MGGSTRRRVVGHALGLGLGMACLIGPTQTAAAAGDSAGPRARALVASFTAAWDGGNTDMLLALFEADADIRLVGQNGRLTAISGTDRIRRWLDLIRGRTARRTWTGAVEPGAGRVRWTGLFEEPTSEAGGPAVDASAMVLEAALTPEGLISVLGIADSDEAVGAAWHSYSRPNAAGLPPAPRTPHGRPSVRAGPSEGDYRPVAAGAVLAAGALALRRLGR